MINRLLDGIAERAVVRYRQTHSSGDACAVQTRLDRLEHLRGMVVKAGLQKLFACKHFSICDLESLMDVAGIQGHDGIVTTLRPLHCMNWGDMTKELQQEVAHHILTIFEGGSA